MQNKALLFRRDRRPLAHTQTEETTMAKGQVRGNKETRKPKKDKTVTKTVSSEGSQVKLAGGNATFGKKDKK
jgi:hypothetical protein